MAKVATKGLKLSQTVGTAYVDIAQLLSVDKDPSKVNTFNTTTLDGGVFETKQITGFCAPGDASAELFYDPALAGHQGITDQITTPAFANWKITYSDAASTTQIFSAVPSFGMSAALGDGIKGNLTLEISGDPVWPT